MKTVKIGSEEHKNLVQERLAVVGTVVLVIIAGRAVIGITKNAFDARKLRKLTSANAN